MAGVKGQRSGGHNRKPTQLHVLRGTFRKDRHGDTTSPDPAKGKPPVPKGLVGEAKAEWERMVARLEEAKTLSIVDDAALYQYVNLYAETEAIKGQAAGVAKLITEAKTAVKGLEGIDLIQAIEKILELQKLQVRMTTQLRQGHMAIRQYLVEFGMTPAARSRVKLPAGAEKPKSRIEQFMAGQLG